MICVGLTTTILVCESPSPCSLTCDAVVKFVPVSVTLTDVPLAPLEGITEVSVGRPLAPFTVKAAVLLVPPASRDGNIVSAGCGAGGNIQRRGDLSATDDGHIAHRNPTAGDSDRRSSDKA